MKTKAQPASVHDADEDGNPILHSKVSAATKVVKLPSRAPLSRKMNKKNSFYAEVGKPYVNGKSICKGPIEEFVRIESVNRTYPLTIFSRSRDLSYERNAIGDCKFRKIFWTDDTETLEPNASYEKSRCVRLTFFYPEKEKGSSEHKIYVEQQTSQGKEQKILVHQLDLLDAQAGIDYVFRGCGDADPHSNKIRDLVVKTQSLTQESFDDYIGRANSYGYRRRQDVIIDRHKLLQGFKLPLPSPIKGTESKHTISFDPEDLQILLDAKQKKQRVLPTGGKSASQVELLKLLLHGVGECNEDGTHAGDLDLRVIYNP